MDDLAQDIAEFSTANSRSKFNTHPAHVCLIFEQFSPTRASVRTGSQCLERCPFLYHFDMLLLKVVAMLLIRQLGGS